jgi:sigma-B regulation protein RsbU (phosphoserine phosphatase)
MTGPTNKKIVSIVDDEIDVTELFHEALCNNIDGITVVTFNEPVLALEHFTDNKENYALVISDLRMPNLNGLELLKKIKKLNEKVRTTLISAYDIENNVVFQHYAQLGIIDSFIPKPVTINQLCQRVRDEFLVYQLAGNLK